MSDETPINPVGAVMIVGGGIAGIQASLDLAESGYLVYLIERKGSIGGRMSQLDKTFPTNDCSMCMISPKLIGCATHPNINIITKAELIHVEGEPGRFRAIVKKHPRYVDEEKCVGCGICVQKCPAKAINEFNQGLDKRKAVHLLYPQAVPLVYEIDRDHCIYFKNKRCRACEKFCKNNAIDFEQRHEESTLEVGSIILAPGLDLFDAAGAPEYGYDRYPNVITTMEFERCLSATGPSDGEILRISDKTVPNKMAWIQCVGSRESIREGREFCSSVCCMAATKEAVIAKSHHPELEPSIFLMDLRAQGKGFDSYCERAESQSGVRYIRSMISRVVENPVTHDLELAYQDPETGQKVDEVFNLIVLAVGLSPSAEAVLLSDRLGIELDQYGFAKTPVDNPLRTSREGIYVCGGFEGPKDIPETVAQASAVAAEATLPIAESRGYEIVKTILPPERSLFGVGPKIGVFVCCCGTNIAGVVDVEGLAEFAHTLPNVVWAEVFLFACSTDSKVRMKEVILQHDINRVVVASCSPKTHETLFMDTLRDAGLNPYLLEMANIRNQCSWVHSDQSELATRKSKDLLRMSVKRITMQEPIVSQEVPVFPVAVIVGGGLAGLTAAVTIADQGFKTHIVEQSDRLGGRHQETLPTLEGFNPAEYIPGLIERVKSHHKITVHTGCEIEKVDGHVGGFVSKINDQAGGTVSLRHGAAIIATGAEPYRPDTFLYGEHSGVLTQRDLELTIKRDKDKIEAIKNVVMIQCVGSRNQDNPYCSRVCCSQAVANAVRLKKANPEMEILVLYRDIRTFGLKEQYYKIARQKGVLFIRYDLDRPPEVFEEDERLSIRFLEPAIKREIVLSPDLIVLSAAMKPHPKSARIADVYKLPRDDRGYFLEAHVKLRPLDFATDGMFLCGDGHGPKFPEEVMVQAKGAAGRALSILSKDHIQVGPSSQVDPELCAACMTCVRTCPYAVPYINEHGVSQIDPARCRGCGLCASECPALAISVHHYLDEQIEAKVQGLFD